MSSVDIQPAKPPDSDPFGSNHPAKKFKAEAETRSTNRCDDKDRVEFSLGGGRLFSFKGEGDWLDKWGGKLFLAMTSVALVALAWWIRETIK